MLYRRAGGLENPKTLKTARPWRAAYRQGRYAEAEKLYSQSLDNRAAGRARSIPTR